jgi:hypothetical protein
MSGENERFCVNTQTELLDLISNKMLSRFDILLDKKNCPVHRKQLDKK